MTGLLARAASFLVEPTAVAEPGAAAPAGARALVLGSPAEAPPFAAALAGALRVRERAAAALVCVWGASTAAASIWGASTAAASIWGASAAAASTLRASPLGPSTAGPSAPDRSGSGSSTSDLSTRGPSTSGPSASFWSASGARRLAARLTARDFAVHASGRLVWLALPQEPAEAAAALGRLICWLDAPIVTVLAGPRAAEHDELLSDHDLVVAVRPAALSAEATYALTALALQDLDGWSLVCDPLPTGPARWRARAGLARLAPAHPAVAALGPARRAAA
jgi:hypothetical protein